MRGENEFFKFKKVHKKLKMIHFQKKRDYKETKKINGPKANINRFTWAKNIFNPLIILVSFFDKIICSILLH